MVEIKLKIEEDISKNFGNIKMKGINVGIQIEGINATKQEKEVAEYYENLFQTEEKVKFINKTKENKKDIDELIKSIKDSLGI